MAKVTRKTDPAILEIADSVNDLKAFVVAQMRLAKADLATATGAGTSWTVLGAHNDRSERTITSANATDLATSLTLAKEIMAVYAFHGSDTLAHKTADAANVVVAASPTDLATAITAANELKADYELHRVSTTFHEVADTANAVAAANATDQTSLNTLLNELKVDINAHMATGALAKSVRLIDA